MNPCLGARVPHQLQKHSLAHSLTMSEMCPGGVHRMEACRCTSPHGFKGRTRW